MPGKLPLISEPLVSPDSTAEQNRPAPGTRARWAYDYITSTQLSHKVRPPPLPASGNKTSVLETPTPHKPGRPIELRVSAVAPKSPRPGALKDPRRRAMLLHTFWHHELQAAELMCWAYLRFSQAEADFRDGLLRIGLDEVRHMGLYEQQLERLGYPVGSFPVRDWFWQRVPQVSSALGFVSFMGLGLEAANLEHSLRYAQAFDAAGDPSAAEVQRTVGREEVSHVAFGRYWFEQWRGELTFAEWQHHLPPPLPPLMMRGNPVNFKARRQANLPEAFLCELSEWKPAKRGRGRTPDQE